jgi:hypothetical protein
MTVVETARFLKDAKPLLSQSEREELVAFVGRTLRLAKSFRRQMVSGRSAGHWLGKESAAARG